MMKIYKLLPILLTLICMLLSFSSCRQTVEYGDITKVDSNDLSSDKATTTESTSQFKPTEDSLGYKYSTVNIGRAQLQLPYPANWSVEKDTDYDIKFQAPPDDPYFPGESIYFHSTLETSSLSNSQEIINAFEADIQEDTFSVNGTTLSMLPSSYIESFVVDTSISAPEYNYQLTYRDWDANVKNSLTHRLDDKDNIYHQTTSFMWRSFPCILTGMTSEKKADMLYDLLLYMMSNCTYKMDKIEETREVTVFKGPNQIKFPLNTLYKETTSAVTGDEFDKAVTFLCPADSGTGFSHSSISIYEIDEEYYEGISEETIEDMYLDVFLANHFGVTSEDVILYGFLDDTIDGYMRFGSKKVPEYGYTFIFEKVPDSLSGCFANQSWFIALLPIEHNDKIDLVVLTTPKSGIIWSLDNIQLMAKYISYGR